MSRVTCAAAFAAVYAACVCTTGAAADLSPASWPSREREQLEALEAAGTPRLPRVVKYQDAIISAASSPIAVHVGEEALRQGGNAADAVAAIALTQVAMELGSNVSYAGMLGMLYYDAASGRVSSLDAGYGTYAQETEPNSIPTSDISAYNTGFVSDRVQGAAGRKTLVSGFMAGIEATSQRFGKLPYRSLFEPAIWYAEHGVTVSERLADRFAARREAFQRTDQGRRFLGQAGADTPIAGARFYQRDLAKTLRAVARHGSRYMYTGRWARDFVTAVRHDGGRVTIDDLHRYRATWSDAATVAFAGHQVFTNGGSNLVQYQIVPALRMMEFRGLVERPPFWKDPRTFLDLARISASVNNAPTINPHFATTLQADGLGTTPRDQLTENYARVIAARLDDIYGDPSRTRQRSSAVVVMDREGNIAAMTHSVNSALWGDAGIVVSGIPIPDPAGWQQQLLAMIASGQRLPNYAPQALALRNGQPVFASAGVGFSTMDETLKVILSVVGQGQELARVQSAPPLLMNEFYVDKPQIPPPAQSVAITEGAFDADFVTKLEALGAVVATQPMTWRGTVNAVVRDPQSGVMTAVEVPGLRLFVGGH